MAGSTLVLSVRRFVFKTPDFGFTTTITIILSGAPCGLTPDGVLSRIGDTDLTIKLEGRQGAAKVEESYATFENLA